MEGLCRKGVGINMIRRNGKRKLVTILLGAMLAVGPIQMAWNPVLTVEAHSGRTDSNGGHHDYKNKSGLGSYHYHCGGYPAHLHENGVCPYSGSGNVAEYDDFSVSVEPCDITHNAHGWQRDATGWWYEDYEGHCVKNGMYYIDDHCFLFNDSGYMLTGWQKIEDDWYYFDENGYMAVGWKEINSIWYCFDEDGCMMTGAHCVDDCFYHFRSDGSWDGKYYSTYLECWEAE